MNTFRNRLAHWLANRALGLATPEYRDMIGAMIQYGLRSAARDQAEGRPAPVDPRYQSDRR